jgi:PAS domain S-box-containing protein
MLNAPIPVDETVRLDALLNLGLLDTPPEERFDRITRLAARVFGVPISTVTLVDHTREWHKSCHGVSEREQDRAVSFCGHALLAEDVFVVSDTHDDDRFRDNPMVAGDPHIRFYAGVPLRSADGSRVGTFCLKGREPRVLTPDERRTLAEMAKWVELELNVYSVQEALEARRRVESELDWFFALASDLMCVAGTDGFFKRVNPAFSSVLGYTEDELLGRPFFDFIHTDDRVATVAEIKALSEGATTVDFQNRYLKKDGSYIWIRWNAAPRGDRIYATGVDVSAAKAREEALRERNGMLQLIFDSMPVMVALYDEAGKIRFLNQELERVMGWSRQELQHIDLLAECYPDAALRADILQVMLHPDDRWHDFPTRTRSGETIETSWFNVHIEGGRSIGIGQDITYGKRLERKLAESRDEAIDSARVKWSSSRWCRMNCGRR